MRMIVDGDYIDDDGAMMVDGDYIDDEDYNDNEDEDDVERVEHVNSISQLGDVFFKKFLCGALTGVSGGPNRRGRAPPALLNPSPSNVSKQQRTAKKVGDASYS
jgi:hypothetical protein